MARYACAVRLGLSIEIQEGMTYAQTLAMTLAAERLEFDTSLLAEHYYPSGVADLYTEQPLSADAWLYLGGLARETSRINLGTLVSPVTFRHPSVLAKMAATLDHLSAGRAELGMGAGWLEGEHQAYGFAFPAAPRRVDLLEEQLQVITGLFTSDAPFSHTGAAYTLREARFTPRAQPKVIVGGSTTAVRLPKLAARYADEYVINSPSLDDCRAARQRLDRECQALGRDPRTLRLSAFVAICVARTDAEVERIEADYARSNAQYARMLRTRTNWIAGTPDAARRQLDALAEAGIDRALLSVNADVHLQMLPLLTA
jgi:alkanesulfonate monooxygenase SsuD/methylene tetrahydromethanopterin reductase-like flavin-dependent oxidoreductase (luciferase family)